MAKTLGSLSVGDKVKFGTYHGAPVIWKISDKNHAGYPAGSVSLITERIIRIAMFDGMEASNSDSDRKSSGNNSYLHSNLLQWLNKDGAANSWYAAQHSADSPPTDENSNAGNNGYDDKPGFLNEWSADDKAALLSTTVVVNKASVDGGGQENVTSKVFLLSYAEVGLSGDAAEGSAHQLFASGGNSGRVATPTADAVASSEYTDSYLNVNAGWYYWCRSPYVLNSYYVRIVNTYGSTDFNSARDGNTGVRPACNLLSSNLVSDLPDSDGCYTMIYNQPPTMPGSINVPVEVFGGTQLSVDWGQSTDPEGKSVSYKLEKKIDSGSWTLMYTGTERSYTDTAQVGSSTMQYRVKAVDADDIESDYRTSSSITVIANQPPTISGSDTDLGVFGDTFSGYNYTVNDADSSSVSVQEIIDDVISRTFTPAIGQQQSFALTGLNWIKIQNGTHTVRIVATDSGGAVATRTITFTKDVDTVELKTQILNADAKPVAVLVNVQGSFPSGSILTVLATNNANDTNPAWQDISGRLGSKAFFSNESKTAASWGVQLHVKLERGTATLPCYIASIGGGFA